MLIMHWALLFNILSHKKENVFFFCIFDSIDLNFSTCYPWLDGVRTETAMKGGLFIGFL